MLTKVNLGLNIILLVAVGYLFFRDTSAFPKATDAGVEQGHAAVEDSSASPALQSDAAPNIVYINGEILNEEYEFISAKYEELEKEQMRIESQIERKMRAAEERYLELEGQAPTMTPSQIEQAQIELQQLQEDIARFQEKAASDFRKKEEKTQEAFFRNIQSFLEGYNEEKQYDYILTYQIGGQVLLANDSLDVTREVVDGLNAAYRSQNEPAQQNP